MLPLALLFLAGAAAPSADPAAPALTVVRPRDTGQALVNPAMGWTFAFYSNIPANYGSRLPPSDTVDDWPGLSAVYLRVPWAYLEPREGEFNWPLLDTPAQRWIARGKKVALRITCSENWLRYATPEWVRQAGAKGVEYEWGKGPKPGGPLWDPDFLDPVFLARLDRLLAALARRYEGNPDVAFVDIGSFGMWGEGHTGGSSRLSDDRTLAVVTRHLELHKKHFPTTLLTLNDDVVGPDRRGRRFPATDRALAAGVTLRDDSILVQPPPRAWYHDELAQDFWPRLPVVLEHEHYGASKARKAWGDGSKLLEAVEAYHASYLSIHWWPREQLQETAPLVDRINRRLGYRLVPTRLAWPARVAVGQPFTAEGDWTNAGVAPCYPGGFPAWTFKDAKGGIAAVLVDEGLDVRSLKVAPPGQAPAVPSRARFTVGQVAPAVPPGTYDIFVSVGRRDGTPTLALPLPDGDGQRRYKVGQVRVSAPQP